MASSKRFLGLLFVMFMEFLSSSQAYKFIVGSKDGWVLNPSMNFNRWAERNRFQVNDTLFFKYKKGDSVLVVTKDDYFSCNTKNPIISLTDGGSIFKLDHSGPFFFVSGNANSCRKGQKLIVVVLAVRDKPHHPPPAADPPVSPPSVQPPSGLSPRAESPEPSANQTEKSGVSVGSSISVWLILCVSVGVSVVLGSFVGMF